ncbi:MAG: heme NO-binding domain-containing protein [Proteobacteria bacterium]|nr:heme NO-binding domain-containing protein [Pseudomonadota bacterium]
MYGLINKGLKNYIEQTFGATAWTAITDSLGLQIGEFIAMKIYDDELTYKLVAAASQNLELSPAEFLRLFGRHWIIYTAEHGYGQLLPIFGRNLREFLGNLNHMHAHMGGAMPGLNAPIFTVTDLGQTMSLRYESKRDGLAPMVLGLLEGLAERFSTQVEISQILYRASSGHDEFTIRMIT